MLHLLNVRQILEKNKNKKPPKKHHTPPIKTKKSFARSSLHNAFVGRLIPIQVERYNTLQDITLTFFQIT